MGEKRGLNCKREKWIIFKSKLEEKNLLEIRKNEKLEPGPSKICQEGFIDKQT